MTSKLTPVRSGAGTERGPDRGDRGQLAHLVKTGDRGAQDVAGELEFQTEGEESAQSQPDPVEPVSGRCDAFAPRIRTTPDTTNYANAHVAPARMTAAPDLTWRQPWGREDLAAYFVSLSGDSLGLAGEAPSIGSPICFGPCRRETNAVAGQDPVHGAGVQAEAAGDPGRSQPVGDAEFDDPLLGFAWGLCRVVVRAAERSVIPAAPCCWYRSAHRLAVVVETWNRSAARRNGHLSSTTQRASSDRPRGVSLALAWIPAAEIATIGDMPNDVLMFAHSGLGIAMGNASIEVQRAARRVTTSNEDEGFANAVERYILRSPATVSR